MPIKNLIFDLGNVIIDLNIARSERLFEELMGVSFKEAEKGDLQTFLDYETGKISEAIFINYFIKRALKPIQARDVIDAWNAMLAGIPRARLEMMRRLSEDYQTFILSNTNETHLRWVGSYLKETYDLEHLGQFVHHTYYSHEMGLRKPDEEIYMTLLQNHQLDPSQTLFFDDNEHNIEGAKACDIKAVMVHPDEEVQAVVKKSLLRYG